ncbi:hypothetical protein EDB86DRAFT_3103608 [Lactarius hatsudake]|nr:hypothetical protein EDB86DRAFT_3103608 [Lactarius hatsudake]
MPPKVGHTAREIGGWLGYLSCQSVLSCLHQFSSSSRTIIHPLLTRDIPHLYCHAFYQHFGLPSFARHPCRRWSHHRPGQA